MGGSAHISYATGGIVLAGGLYAFLSKGSKPSLIASSIFALAFFGGGFLVQNGNDFNGHSLSLVASSTLASFGAYRFISTKKPFPSLPLLILGGITSAYQVLKVAEWSQ